MFSLIAFFSYKLPTSEDKCDSFALKHQKKKSSDASDADMLPSDWGLFGGGLTLEWNATLISTADHHAKSAVIEDGRRAVMTVMIRGGR